MKTCFKSNNIANMVQLFYIAIQSKIEIKLKSNTNKTLKPLIDDH